MKWIHDTSWFRLCLDGPMEKITGKYLFFSADRELLTTVAESECSEHGFFAAKISVSPSGSEYVLCLYWFNDSRKKELAKRHGKTANLKYRYWKSDEATKRGEYSEQHLQSKINDERHLEEEFEDCMGDVDRPY